MNVLFGLGIMPGLFVKKSGKRRKKRLNSGEYSIDFLRATGTFVKSPRPKSDVISGCAATYGDFSQDNLDVPSSGSRNVKTAPSTPDVESRGFGSSASSRYTESPGQIDMATVPPGGGVGSAGATAPSPTSPVNSNTQALVKSTSKHDRPNSMDSSGQKSPHKEVSPKMSKSRNEKFHRLFKCVPEDEYLYNTYSCAFFGDILLQGYLYISQNWFCFYSKILGHEKLIEIPVSKVITISREKTAFIIPNAIGIRTEDEKYVFGSLLSRDSTFKLMRRIWELSDPCPPGEKDTDEEVSENNNNLECEDSNSGTEISRAIPQSATAAGQLAPDSSCESSESDTRLLCKQCGEDIMDQGISEEDAPPTEFHRPTHPTPSRQHSRIHRSGHGIPFLNPRRAGSTISRTATKLQSMPRINLLLVVCTALSLFLLLSALVLTYKVVALQARLDMVSQASPQWNNPTNDNDMLNKDAYYLNSQYHAATIERFHNIIRANIQVLGQVHNSLKNLHESSELTTCGPNCPGGEDNKTP